MIRVTGRTQGAVSSSFDIAGADQRRIFIIVMPRCTWLRVEERERGGVMEGMAAQGMGADSRGHCGEEVRERV